jgi:hypothetical protein
MAGTLKEFSQGSNLADGNNYTPSGTPTMAHDVLLATEESILTGGRQTTMSSLNQTNEANYTIGSDLTLA